MVEKNRSRNQQNTIMATNIGPTQPTSTSPEKTCPPPRSMPPPIPHPEDPHWTTPRCAATLSAVHSAGAPVSTRKCLHHLPAPKTTRTTWRIHPLSPRLRATLGNTAISAVDDTGEQQQAKRTLPQSVGFEQTGRSNEISSTGAIAFSTKTSETCNTARELRGRPTEGHRLTPVNSAGRARCLPPPMNTPHPPTHARELAPPAPPSSCTPYHAQRSRNAREPSGKGQICRFLDAISAAAAHPALTTSPHGHTTRNTAFPPSPSSRPPSALPPARRSAALIKRLGLNVGRPPGHARHHLT
eukprot:COSAG02_NODE_458_length_21942_cov_1643.812068_17_plen_299_part_00